MDCFLRSWPCSPLPTPKKGTLLEFPQPLVQTTHSATLMDLLMLDHQATISTGPLDIQLEFTHPLAPTTHTVKIVMS